MSVDPVMLLAEALLDCTVERPWPRDEESAYIAAMDLADALETAGVYLVTRRWLLTLPGGNVLEPGPETA